MLGVTGTDLQRPLEATAMLDSATPPVTAPGNDIPADRLTALISALVIPGDRATALRLLAGAR